MPKPYLIFEEDIFTVTINIDFQRYYLANFLYFCIIVLSVHLLLDLFSSGHYKIKE